MGNFAAVDGFHAFERGDNDVLLLHMTSLTSSSTRAPDPIPCPGQSQYLDASLFLTALLDLKPRSKYELVRMIEIVMAIGSLPWFTFAGIESQSFAKLS